MRIPPGGFYASIALGALLGAGAFAYQGELVGTVVMAVVIALMGLAAISTATWKG